MKKTANYDVRRGSIDRNESTKEAESDDCIVNNVSGIKINFIFNLICTAFFYYEHSYNIYYLYTVYKNIGKPVTSNYSPSRCVPHILATCIKFLKFIPNARFSMCCRC